MSMRVMMIGGLGGQLGIATKIAKDRGASVSWVDSVGQATEALRRGQGADLLMVDAALDIHALIRANEAERIIVPVVACGVDTTPERAAEVIRMGAQEFIPLPPDAELIAAVLAAVARDERAVIAEDPSMKAVLHFADQIAPSDAPVLITGESGVGKEVIARHVHQRSRRKAKPFIAINCAAIPENLLESELFGHEKGAFTGAVARRIGKFEEADGGTLLLDEVSEMDIRLQAKLLRALQEREIDRVGGTKPVKVDIRILATSNRDLIKAVEQGTFREDLLFRLNVVNLSVPPLRERPADIEALARHFVIKYAEANGLKARSVSSEALAQLKTCLWRGNVRELENTIHRAVLLSSGQVVEAEALRSPTGGSLSLGMAQDASTALSLGLPGHGSVTARAAAAADAIQRDLVGRTVADVEQDLILSTLDHCFGNRTHASNILGISIRTLRNKLRAYHDEGIDIPQPGERRVAS
jgi:two-component system, response regulator FlrC